MIDKLHKKLLLRKEEGTLRSLSLFTGKIDFWSNDYLGLARENNVLGSHSGSTGSRLISGTSEEALRCEDQLAQFFKAEMALVYNSGYDANLGFFSAVPQKGDLILYDEHIHASVRDGVRLSFAKSFSFKHNSLIDLEKRLQLDGEVKYVAIESLYSMGGDVAPLDEMVALCEAYNAYLVVDEAHAAGVFGNAGRGLVEGLGLNERVFARLVTFGKAYGAHGACILGPSWLHDYLINFSRSFIYTTALPPATYDYIAGVVKQSCIDERKAMLKSKIAYFRQKLKSLPLPSHEHSPIQIIYTHDVVKANALVNQLMENGIAAKAIVSPTVAKGDEGIRVCIHAFNTESEIDLLTSVILNYSN